MHSFYTRILTLSALLACFFAGESRLAAANIAASLVGNNTVKRADPNYNDGESVVIQSTSGGITFLTSAVNYGVDPALDERWGLIDADKSWRRNKKEVLLEHGFAPNAQGSKVHGTGADQVDASYLSIKINKSSATLFTSIRVDIKATFFSLPSTAWAGSSADNFSSMADPSRGAVDGRGRTYSWDFANLNYAGNEPLELRFYGLQGVDAATLDNIRLQLEASPIPEPTTCVLVVGMLGLVVLRRRR